MSLAPLESLDTLDPQSAELGLPKIKALGCETKEAFIQEKLYLLRSFP